MFENDYPQIICYGPRDKIPNDYLKINTTSTSKEWSRIFSPFFLGPVEIEPILGEKQVSTTFENAWQYSKKYKWQTLKEWKEWSQEGFNKKKAVRYPMGKGSKPEYSLHLGNKLDYIEARFKIYAPLYEQAILKYANEEYEKLKKMYDSGEKIALFDFDGHGYHLANLKLEDVIYNEKHKMGHSFVLMGMITGNRFWNKPYDRNLIFSKSVPYYK